LIEAPCPAPTGPAFRTSGRAQRLLPQIELNHHVSDHRVLDPELIPALREILAGVELTALGGQLNM
jgi:hypothetical protein